jgi:hypothetical protein
MKRIFLSLAGFVTLFGLMAAPVQSTVLATPTVETEAQPEAETFFGTILKSGENFVLSDPATKSRYALDNPKEASPYQGMTVKVTGTIETASNLIHVESIQGIT